MCYLPYEDVGSTVEDKGEWSEFAKRLIKAELKRVSVSYQDLADKLKEMGIEETEGSIAVKINRGTFPAWFFFAAMKAIGRDNVRLAD